MSETPSYTESQLAEFKEEFARRRRRQFMVSGIAIVLAVLVGLTAGRESHTILGLPAVAGLTLFFVALAIIVVFSFRNWRCPACNGHFSRGMMRRFCSRCGVALR